MKVCLNIDCTFNLYEIVVLANFHDKYSRKSKKNLLHFYPFLFLKKKTMTQCLYDPLYHIVQYYGSHAKQIERIAAF